eukprot:69477_1
MSAEQGLATALTIDVEDEEKAPRKHKDTIDGLMTVDDKHPGLHPKKPKSKKCLTRVVNFFMKGVKPFQRISAFLDIYSDFVLLYKTSKDPNLIVITCIMLISILSPYLVCYATGIRLYLNRGAFTSATNQPNCCKKALLLLYVIPTGVLWYIFLDVYVDVTGILVLAPYYLFKVCNSLTPEKDLESIKRRIANWIGLTFMNLEGYTRMRSISQLMLESIPQIIIQTMLAFGVIRISNTTITSFDILLSIGSAVINMTSQFAVMKMESIVVRETFLSYALSCMIGRVGWIPFLTTIHIHHEEKGYTVKYDSIKKKFFGFVPKTINYVFSDVTIKKFIEHLASIPANDKDVTIVLGDTCKFIDVQLMLQFVTAAKNKIIIRDIHQMDWNRFCKVSVKHRKNISQLEHATSSDGQLLLQMAFDYHLNQLHKPKRDDQAAEDSHGQAGQGQALERPALHQSPLFIFNALLENGINLCAVNFYNETMIHWLVRHCADNVLHMDALRACMSKTKQLKDVNLNLISDVSQRTSIMDALEHHLRKDSNTDIWDLVFEHLDSFETHSFDMSAKFFKYCYVRANTDDLHINRKIMTILKEMHQKYSHKLDDSYKTAIIDFAILYVFQVYVGRRDDTYSTADTIPRLKEQLQMIAVDPAKLHEYNPNEDNLLCWMVRKARNSLKKIPTIMTRIFDDQSLKEKGFDPWSKNKYGQNFVHIMFDIKSTYLWYTKWEKHVEKWIDETRALRTLLKKEKEKWFDANDAEFVEMFVEWYYHEFEESWFVIEKNYHNDWPDAKSAYFAIENEEIAGKIVKKFITKANEETNDTIKKYRQLFVGYLLTRCGLHVGNANKETQIACENAIAQFESFEKSDKKDINDDVKEETKEETKEEETPVDMQQEEKQIVIQTETVRSVHRDTHHAQSHLYTVCSVEAKDCVMVPLMDHAIDRKPMNDRLDDMSRRCLSGDGDSELIEPFEHLAPNEDHTNSFSSSWNVFRIIVLMVEVLAAADLVTDIVILSKFVQHGHVWWSSFTITMMLSPYYISTASLLFLLKAERDFFAQQQKGITKLLKNVFGAIYISPLGVAYFMFIDVFFVITTLIKEILSILTCGYFDECLSKISIDVLLRTLQLSQMDIEGYSRLRTIAQIAFESLPQIALQIRILFSSDKQDLGVTEMELMLSLLFAFSHGSIEAIAIYYEAQCCRMDYLLYCIICLNARSSFVPFVHLFDSGDVEKKDSFDFDLGAQACNTVQFKMKYQFSTETFAKFLTSLSYLVETDHSEDGHLDNAKIILHGFNVKQINIKSLCEAKYRTQDKIAKVELKGIDFENALQLTKRAEEMDEKDVANITDNHNQSLLYRFVTYGQKDAVIVLLNNDVNVYCSTPNPDETLIQSAMIKKQHQMFYILLHRALNEKHKSDKKIFTEFWQLSNYGKFRQHNVFERVVTHHYSVGMVHSLCLNGVPLRKSFLLQRILGQLDQLEKKEEEEADAIMKECRSLVHIGGWHYDYQKDIEQMEIQKNRSYHVQQAKLEEIRNNEALTNMEISIKFERDDKEAVAVDYKQLDRFLVLREYLMISKSSSIDLSLYNVDKRTLLDIVHAIEVGKPYVVDCLCETDIIKMDEAVTELRMTYGLSKYIMATQHLRKRERVKFNRYDKAINLLSRHEGTHGRGRMKYPEELTYVLPKRMASLTRLELTANARDQDIWGTGNDQIGIHVFRNNILIRDYVMINIDHNKHRGYYDWHRTLTIDDDDDNDALDANGVVGGDVLKIYCFSHAGDGWDLYCKWIDFSLEYVLLDTTLQQNDVKQIAMEFKLEKNEQDEQDQWW